MANARKIPLAVFYILGIIIAVAAFLIPLWRPGFIKTDDGSWMVIRLSAFYQSFREGQFPVRFLGRLNQGYGYPVANFLYPGFLYIGSLIHLLGFSFVTSVKIIFSVSVLGFGFFIYLWLQTFFRKWASLIGSISAIFAPYLLFDVYTRGSVGEVFAMLWVAVCLYSAEAGIIWLWTVGIALLIVSHNTMALLFVPFLLGYILVRKKGNEYALPTVLGVGMATFFWFPALHDRKYVVFDHAAVANPSDYFLKIGNFWLAGPLQIISGVWLLFVHKKHPALRSFLFGVLFLSILVALPVSSFLWKSTALIKLIQFPFRFLAVSLVVGAWTIACVVDSVRIRAVWLVAGVSCAWGIVLWNFYTSTTYMFEPEGFYTTNEATTTVSDEYMPKWVMTKPDKRANSRIEFFDGKGEITVRKLSTQYVDVTVHAREKSTLQFNTVYYPGWGILVDDVLVKPDYANKYGLMRVPIAPGNHHVVAAFRETVSRFLADIVSAVSLVLAILYVVVSPKNRKKT